MRELISNKATMFGNIPTKVLKQSSKSCSDALQKLFHDSLKHGNFSDKPKYADETPELTNMIQQRHGIIHQQVFYQEFQNFCLF